ncbi:MAG: hypothetical protein G5701_03545 [Serratia symbiotica]|nr:hypothetical protein [Serratia symbiotica]
MAGIGLRRERAEQAVATLSGGEKKVAMLAISHKPGSILLLLDETDNHYICHSRIYYPAPTPFSDF